ncbi:MAG: carbohydrate kinase family protein [Candidatus Staskawiczbacteria bacterium]|nr:carbohydrate kinase family protein [Candidatus Staskawiczbacteria bacterium]
MFDIITFGSASKDIFIKSGAFKVLHNNNDFIAGKGICLDLGSKIDVDDIVFASGGGGTNTAATFARQGFKTAFCGAVGDDIAGREIIEELKKISVDTKFVLKKEEKSTNHSIIVLSGKEDRTILVYRGAAELADIKDIPIEKLKTRWIYLAPLSGLLCDNFASIVDFASRNKIKIALNPSKQQLDLPAKTLKNILQKTDILFLNQEEASILAKIPFSQEMEIFRKIDEMFPGILVMTKGGKGVAVSDGKLFYSAKPDPGRKIVDTTGAGDSLASGFLSEFIKTKGNIESAIQFGLANSAANLSRVGAKTGLLDKESKFERVQVLKENN